MKRTNERPGVQRRLDFDSLFVLHFFLDHSPLPSVTLVRENTTTTRVPGLDPHPLTTGSGSVT